MSAVPNNNCRPEPTAAVVGQAFSCLEWTQAAAARAGTAVGHRAHSFRIHFVRTDLWFICNLCPTPSTSSHPPASHPASSFAFRRFTAGA
eukprot:3825735-Pyramimonas_sp.AAC.1